MVRDEEKEVVWLLIPPYNGGLAYLNNVLVYSTSGEFLFHAPPHILYSEKQGCSSHGVLSHVDWTTRYGGFADISAVEWTVSADGVVMHCYDVRDTMDQETEEIEFSIPGIMSVTEWCFSKQGYRKSRQSYEPSSAPYAALREKLDTLKASAPSVRTEALHHVASLVDVETSDHPVWQSGMNPIPPPYPNMG